MDGKVRRAPTMDSVERLAAFWDAHDLTDFEAELETVSDPVFVKRKADTTVAIALERNEAATLKRIAKSQGVKESTLVRRWIREHLRRSPARSSKTKTSSPVRRAHQG